jgi:nucleotide-binding universal stress UspA family protein
MGNTSPQFDGVVVGVDGSEQGYAAARYAAEEAGRLAVRLHLVHVLPSAIPVTPEVVPVLSESTLQAFGAGILEHARALAVQVDPEVDLETHLLSGARASELVACAEGARMIVLGSRRPRLLDRIWTGGTVTEVAGSAACPVVVVPADWERTPHGRIVVGVASVEASGGPHELWDMAFPLAAERGAEMVVVHAWWLGGTYDAVVADQGAAEHLQRARARLIEDELTSYRASFPEVAVHVFVRHEEPAHALVRVSRGAELLLVQRPAAGRMTHHLGRVARALLRQAHCPVVVVPQPRRAFGHEHEDQTEALVR